MELNTEKQGSPRVSSHFEKTEIDLTNMTILSTPRPQASSTVERRMFGSQIPENNFTSENYRRFHSSPPENIDNSAKSNDSSLGIIDNLPSFLSDDVALVERTKSSCASITDERELARKLLQRCSEIHTSNSIQDTNKENNANWQNLSAERTPSTLVDSAELFNLTPSILKDQSTLRTPTQKISMTSMTFEPDEITARSSTMSKSSEGKDVQSSTESTGGISFGPTTAGLIAQFENEDFQSGSQMSSQLLADEISWQQNASYALPIATSSEKEHLELSCFSGIIGDLDLTVESCAGRKVSVGEFFKRKCGNIGQLSDVDSQSDRPSFGLNIRSPKRIGKNTPLVDMTTMTEDSTNDGEKTDRLLGSFADTKEHTLMSLSTIAQTLQGIDNATPRRLVDQLLMAKKQGKKLPQTKGQNLTSETYTLIPNCRNSLPVSSSNESKKFDKETILLGRSSKLSLDSKNINDSPVLNCQKIPRISIESRESGNTADYQAENSLAELLGEKLKVREPLSLNLTSSKSEKNDVKNYSTVKQSPVQSPKNFIQMDPSPQSRDSQIDFIRRKNTQSPRNINQALIKKEDISAQRSALEASVSNTNDQSRPNENIEIGRSNEELQHCIVGIRREVDVQIVSKSHRWIMCSLSLSEIQGDKDNIELEVAPKIMLIPDACKTIKIGVKVLKAIKPMRVALNAEMSEMVTKSTWQMQHTIWIVPEEPNIVVLTQTGKDEFDFQTTGESSSKLQTIKLENKNSVDFPLKLSIVDNDRHRFTLEHHEDNPHDQTRSQNDSLCVILKPSERFHAVIRYNGTHEGERKKLTNCNAKLLLSIHQRERDVPIREFTLRVQPTPTQSTSVPQERTSDYFRCDTPQYRGTISSPTSPHSSGSNRSGISGRNSPLSSASGGTVAGDVISIRATHAALVWNSIKVGKQDTKEFTIRNTSNNKIKLQATIVDEYKSFKFLRERQQVATHIVLSLQRMESRTFSVVFGPNNAGPVCARIVFRHYEPKRESADSRPSKVIHLFGFGGIGKVEITEAFKDTGGQLWLSLGSLNAGGTLDARIKLQNTGDLCSYAKVKLTPKAVYPAMVSSWHVEPTELLLGPREVRWVTLEFRPRKEDLALLKRANVSHVGTLTITHGDEPTRLRIRRLYKKLSQNGQMSGKENEAFRNVVYPICKVFPGEMPINNLNIIRDSVENLGDLCRGVRQHEVMLTMEVNAEESMSILHDNADDSQTFYSLCSDNSHIFPATEESFMPSETLMECTVDQPIYEDDFMVNPTMVTLTPPTVNEATVMITSSSSVAQPFETVLSHGEYLSVVPAEGMIPARRGFPLRVHCKKRLDHNLNAILQVYTANDKRDVQIRVTLC